MKIKEIIKSIYIDPLYYFQSVEYDLSKFIAYITKYFFTFKIFSMHENHKWKIQFTSKIKIYLASTLILQLITILSLYKITSLFLVLTLVIIYLTPLYIALSNVIFLNLEKIVKKYIVKKAFDKINNIKNLKIIVVTGAYGKTSTTSFIKTLVGNDIKLFTPHYGYNTLMGICNEINKYMPNDTEILLLEVGAYKRGEVKEICMLFPPDITVITSKGTQHLEKFKNEDDILLTDLESIECSKENAVVITIPEIAFSPLFKKIPHRKYIIPKFNINDFKDLKTYFSIEGYSEFTNLHVSLLGTHLIGNLTLSIIVSSLVGIKNIVSKLTLITPVKSRMNPKVVNESLYIDDMYNIGFESAKAAIETISLIKDKDNYKRIIVCTGGIVELGTESQKYNKLYGELLEKAADIIVLFPTPFKSFVEEGIMNKDKIKHISGYNEFYSECDKIVAKHDIILMQNEIADQYYIT